jgi:hypothetical protein
MLVTALLDYAGVHIVLKVPVADLRSALLAWMTYRKTNRVEPERSIQLCVLLGEPVFQELHCQLDCTMYYISQLTLSKKKSAFFSPSTLFMLARNWCSCPCNVS